MTLYHKVRAVEKVFGQLQVEIQKFQERSALSCLEKCGKCCTKPDIEASPIEFLPLAYHLFRNGKLEEFYEKICERKNDEVCILFNPFLNLHEKGNCSNYLHRGLICRAFGFSANYDKNNIPRLITCQSIKSSFSEEVAVANTSIKNGMPIPIITNYYQKLYAIDINLAGKFMPVNLAILDAAKTVFGYYSYRSRPGKKSA